MRDERPHELQCLVYDTQGGVCDCPPPHRKGRPAGFPSGVTDLFDHAPLNDLGDE